MNKALSVLFALLVFGGGVVAPHAEVAKSGELGWTWGTYDLHTKDAEGKPVVRYGKYVNVWRKQKDGTWKVILDMGNAIPAPATP